MSGLHARDSDIVSRFQVGETLQSIADRYGLTRERVRQIARKHVTVTRRQQARALDAQIAKDIAARRLTRQAAVAAYGASVADRAARKFGVVYPAKAPEPAVVEAAALVSEGMSIHQASNGDHALEMRVSHYCRKMGIVSRHGRWLDRAERAQAVKRMRAAGATWAEIAAYVGSMEGKPLVTGAICQWVKTHMAPEDYAKPARAKAPPAVPPRSRNGSRSCWHRPNAARARNVRSQRLPITLTSRRLPNSITATRLHQSSRRFTACPAMSSLAIGFGFAGPVCWHEPISTQFRAGHLLPLRGRQPGFSPGLGCHPILNVVTSTAIEW